MQNFFTRIIVLIKWFEKKRLLKTTLFLIIDINTEIWERIGKLLLLIEKTRNKFYQIGNKSVNVSSQGGSQA